MRIQPGERANRDFVLRLAYGTGSEAGDHGAELAVEDAEGGEGTFRLTVLPPAGEAPARPAGRGAACSTGRAAWHGWKMVAARRAAARIVDTLTGADRFAVLTFDNRGRAPADAARAGWSRRATGTASARSSTCPGSRRAAAPSCSRPLTGRSTLLGPATGDAGPRPGAGAGHRRAGRQRGPDPAATAGQLAGVRVHTVGIDQAVNAGFLGRLAGARRRPVRAGGERGPAGRGRWTASTAASARRCVTGLELRAGADWPLDGTLAPARLPDLFPGVPLVVTRPLHGRAGRRGHGARAHPHGQRVDGPAVPGAAAPRRRAGRRLGPGPPARPGGPLRHRAAPRRWSGPSRRRRCASGCCAGSPPGRGGQRVVNEGGEQHRVVQPVEVPAGWTMFERAGLAAAAMPMARMSAGGLQFVGPPAGRVGGSRSPGGKLDTRLGSLPGRAGPGRPGRAGRRRSGGFASQPLGGADLAPYRRRAAQLATLLESDRPLPRPGPPGRVPGSPTTRGRWGPGAADGAGSGGAGGAGGRPRLGGCR